MHCDSVEYQRLPFAPTGKKGTDIEEVTDFETPVLPWGRILVISIIFVQGMLNITLGFHQLLSSGGDLQDSYSPAQDVVEYELKKFTKSFAPYTTRYQGPPTDEVDAAWEDLYSFGVLRIPREQAALLKNKTAPIPGDEENYVISLEVFHQLHCLNMIRQALYPDHYLSKQIGTESLDDWSKHVDHCVDSIRQSLMCSADITPLVWQWQERSQVVAPQLEVVHTCRNFDSIREWARSRHLTESFNRTVHIEDDIEVPIL